MKRIFGILLMACLYCTGMTAQESHMTLPYQNWYSFERPAENYTGSFLRSSIAPAALAGLGLLIQANPDFKQRLQSYLDWNQDWKVPMYEDELRWAPYLVGGLLPAFGLYSQHKPLHTLPLALTSYFFADFCIHRLKIATTIQRPNEKLQHLFNSFPSQHTSMAFVAASLIHLEYGHYSPWISIGCYGVASYVGYTRIAQNYHWTSDVLVGAAIGTFCTHLVYFAYEALADGLTRSKQQRLNMLPSFDGQHASLSLSYQF